MPQRRWAPVRLGIDVRGPLQALPWEALALPGAGTPLALHPLLTVYRLQDAGRAGAPVLAGPLRVVIAISAPLAGGGGVLDYERELRNMLAAVRGARQGQARVRIVHFATTGEIRAALAAEPAHVLHLSGHGRPGAIELEDADGNGRVLDAAQFVAEAIPPGRMPPVIALSACHTDAATAAGDPSFAAALIGLGASAVIGTETAVTDVYATRVFARIYEELAQAEVPEVITAVAQARRTVQQQLTDSPDLRDQQLARLGEWAVLTVLAAAGSVTVIDPSAAPAADERARGAAWRAGASGAVVPRGRGVRRPPPCAAPLARRAARPARGGTGAVRHRRGRQDHPGRRADPADRRARPAAAGRGRRQQPDRWHGHRRTGSWPRWPAPSGASPARYLPWITPSGRTSTGRTGWPPCSKTC